MIWQTAEAVSESQVAYMAGAFDGEGCIRINQSKQACNGKSRYQLQAKVAMKDMVIPAMFRRYFGGSLCSYPRGGISFGYAPLWEWKANGSRAAYVMHILAPYLTVKRAQGELAEEFQKRIHKGGSPKGDVRGFLPITVEELHHRSLYYQKMKALKKIFVHEV